MNSFNIQQKKEKKQSKSYFNKRNIIGWAGCLGGLLIQLVIGSLYQWGIVNIYYTSYFKGIDSSVTLESNAIAFPLMMICIGITMRVGLKFAQMTHPLVVLILDQIMGAAVVFASSFTESIWVFIVLYGILFGLIKGSSYMIPLVQCNKYFPGWKMIVNGFVLIGTGAGPVVFGMFSYSYLNPAKIPPFQGYYLGNSDLQAIAAKVPLFLKFLALLYLLVGLLGVVLIAPVCIDNRRKQNQQIKDKEQNKNKSTESIQINQPSILPNPPKQVINAPNLIHSAHSVHSVHHHANFHVKPAIEAKKDARNLNHFHYPQTIGEAFCSKICWIEVLILILASAGSFMINGNYKTYVKYTINDDEFLTIIGVIGGIGNGFSRFFWNLFFSKTGYKTALLVIVGLSMIIFSTIRFTISIKQIYLIQVFLSNCCIGGFQVTTPTLSQTLYGIVTGSNIYGFYWAVLGLANFISYEYVANLIYKIGFDNIIYICLGMNIIAVPLIVFTKFQGPWHNDTSALQFCVSYQIEKQKQLEIQVLQAFHKKNQEEAIIQFQNQALTGQIILIFESNALKEPVKQLQLVKQSLENSQNQLLKQKPKQQQNDQNYIKNQIN